MDASSSDMLGGTMTQSPGWGQTDVRGGVKPKPFEGVMYLPVCWGGHSLAGCELQRVHRA